MTNHKHATTCEHEIKVCDCCDSAYCTKCEKEWGAQKPCNLNHWPTYIPTYIPYRAPYVFPGYNSWGNPLYGSGFTITSNSSQIGTNTMLQSGSATAY